MGGSSGRTSQATQQRIKIEWKSLRLAQSTGDGYADTSAPLDKLIGEAVKRQAGGSKPAVIWVFDAEDDRKNEQLEKKVFADNKIGLALKRFLCLKAEIQSIPDDKLLRETARKCPMFIFYDPAGEEFGRLAGKKAGSKSGVSSQIEKLWDLSFEVRLKDYSKQMGKLLDELDKIERDKERLTKKMTSAAGKPGKLKGLQKEEEKLKAEEAKLLEKEQELIAACKLRPDFVAKK